MATKLAYQFCITVTKKRNPVCHRFKTKQLADLAGRYCHAIARAQDVMQDFMGVDFKDHPTMSNELVRFSMQYNKQGDNNKKRFDKLTNKIDNLVKQNKNKNENNAEDTKINKLKKDLEELKKNSITLANKVKELPTKQFLEQTYAKK